MNKAQLNREIRKGHRELAKVDYVQLGLDRAEAALRSRDRQDLGMAVAVLVGLLDHTARQDRTDEMWVRAALAECTQALLEVTDEE